MTFELPPLPFAKSALAPHMSEKTLEFHYGKHHRAYVDAANKLVEGTPLDGKPLEEVIRLAAKDAALKPLFDAAAQIWNHTCFWNSLHPRGGGKPGGELAQAIAASFGSYEKFRDEFKSACVGQFGSGWGWLVIDGGKLKVLKTPNALNPMPQGLVTLLACDVWEHAYYLDYQNRRADFVDTFLDHLANWEFAATTLAKNQRKVA